MASPSKSRSATQGSLPNPSNTPNSPNPSDNIDLLLSLEKVVSDENSPSSNKKKRTREETDLSDSDVPQLRRRSNRNPRIGSGFNNQPEHPVHIVDEDVEEDVEVEGRDDAPGVILSVIHEDPLSCFHDLGLIPDSVCTQDTLVQLREDYRIPDSITLSLPHQGYDA